MPIFRGTCPIALIVTVGFAVRKLSSLFFVNSKDFASTADSCREVSVHAVSKSADRLLGGVIVHLLRFCELYLVDLAK